GFSRASGGPNHIVRRASLRTSVCSREIGTSCAASLRTSVCSREIGTSCAASLRTSVCSREIGTSCAASRRSTHPTVELLAVPLLHRTVVTSTSNYIDERAARRSTTQTDTRHGARSLARAEYARRLLHVLRLDPEHRAVSSVAGARGVDGGDVDLGVGQALQQRADRALAIVALDKEDRLRRLELELGALRGAAEGRGVFRNEIEL